MHIEGFWFGCRSRSRSREQYWGLCSGARVPILRARYSVYASPGRTTASMGGTGMLEDGPEGGGGAWILGED
jgi:hypothetical protein